MTTVVGINHPEVEATVLAADRQTTVFDQQTGIPRGKHIGRKLYKNKDDKFGFGIAGSADEEVLDFAQKLNQGKLDIRKAINEGVFKELRETNLERLGYDLPQTKNLFGVVLATRFNENPRLYTCFPLGLVRERTYTSVGSGEQDANEYMNALSTLSDARDYQETSPASTEGVIQAGLESVRRAQRRDPYSHGLDLLVCTPRGINDHYEELGDDFARKLEKVQKNYRPQNNKSSKSSSGKGGKTKSK